MTCSPQEQAQRKRFESVYTRSQNPVMLRIERSVCGCDYGGNSWTTRIEADRFVARLGLRPGMRLLDLGAGSGWPGLYMAKTSGCDLVLVDLPLSGLRIARARAGKDGIAGDALAVVGDAAALPLSDKSFDAISHSDLLCCLRQKRSVLTACRRVIRSNGLMVFTVISVAPGLTAHEYDRAVANGPEFVETDTDYPRMLAETGWLLKGHEDLSDDYAASCRRQLDADMAHADDLRALIGPAEFSERVDGWRSKLAALGDSLLRRECFTAIPHPDWESTPTPAA